MTKELKIIDRIYCGSEFTANIYNGSAIYGSNVYPGDETTLTGTPRTAVLSTENNDLPDGPVGKYIEKVIVSNLDTPLPGPGGVSALVSGQILTADNDFTASVRIYDTKKIGSNVYIAGKFTKLRTGTGSGGSDVLTGLQNLVGYDTVTNTYFDPVGLIISFNEVKTLEVSGNNLYIGGQGTVANESLFVYDTSASTTTLIAGLNHYVEQLYINPILPNLMFIGGSFNQIDNVSMAGSGFCYYDISGGTFTDISGGLPSSFVGLALDGNSTLPVIVGGYSSSVTDVYEWDGVATTAFNTGLSPSDIVYSLKIGTVSSFYIGGNFSEGVKFWNGSSLVSMGSGLSLTSGTAVVRTIEFFDGGKVYVGGNFDSASGTPVTDIAVWNGLSWNAFTDDSIFSGSNAFGVMMLKEIDNDLYMAKTNDSVSVYQLGGTGVTVNISSDVLYEGGALTNPVTIEYDKKKVFTWANDKWIV